jgi:hypothetical protein
MSGNWIAVACAEHVRRGRAGGFMQVCHGRAAPLRRICAGDCVAYYSPSETLRGKDRLQAFTAIGTVCAGQPSIWAAASAPPAATWTGSQPTRRRSRRCSSGWSLRPDGATGAISCASGSSR